MNVPLISTLEFTDGTTNDNANSRCGLNQMPNASMATQRAFQVDLGEGAGEHIYTYMVQR